MVIILPSRIDCLPGVCGSSVFPHCCFYLARMSLLSRIWLGLVLFCFLKENSWGGKPQKNAASAYSPDVLSLMLKMYGGKTREQKDNIERTWKHRRPTEADHSKASCSRVRISAATVRSSSCIIAKATFSHATDPHFYSSLVGPIHLPKLPHSTFLYLPVLHQFGLPWFVLHS